jgi:hypothetical protein
VTLFKFYCIDFFYFLDIFTIESISARSTTTSKNIFKDLNELYKKNVHVELTETLNAAPDPLTQTKDFYIKFTLLPFQILILPRGFQSALPRDRLADFKIYENDEIR